MMKHVSGHKHQRRNGTQKVTTAPVSSKITNAQANRNRVEGLIINDEWENDEEKCQKHLEEFFIDLYDEKNIVDQDWIRCSSEK